MIDGLIDSWELKRIRRPVWLKIGDHPTPTPFHLIKAIVDKYMTEPGRWLDPLAGIGSFALYGAQRATRGDFLQPPIATEWEAVELEPKYANLIRESAETAGVSVEVHEGNCLDFLKLKRNEYVGIFTYPPMGNPNSKIDYGEKRDGQAGQKEFGGSWDSFIQDLLRATLVAVRPGGRMVWISRRFIKNKEVVPTSEFIAEWATQAGWTFEGYHNHASVGHSPFHYINQRKGISGVEDEQVMVWIK